MSSGRTSTCAGILTPSPLRRRGGSPKISSEGLRKRNRTEQPSERAPVRAATSRGQTIRIIPLGGVGEIGKNMSVYEYGNDIVIVDGGLMFPDEEMLGVDLVIPDVTYLQDKLDRIRG